MLTKHLILTLVFAFLLKSATAGWQHDHDSLKAQLDTIESDTARIEKLFEIGEILLENIPQASFNYFIEAKKIATENNDTNYIVLTKLKLCRYYMMISEYSYVLELAFEALEQSGNNKYFLALCHEQISEAYSFMEDYDEAISHIRLTLQIEHERNDTGGIANAMHLIGVNYLEIDQFDSALFYLYQAKDLNLLLNGKPDPFDLSHIGHTYTYMNEFDSALYYHFQALYYDSIEGGNYDMAIDYYYIGFAYYKSGDLDKAVKYLHRSVSRSNQVGLFDVMQFNYDVLSQIYADKEEYSKAYDYALLRNDYADTLRDKNKQSLVQGLEAKYRFEDQQRQLASTEAENLLLEKQSRLLIVLIIVSLLFLLSTIVIIYQINKRHNANRHMLKDVEQANQAKEKIISVISHDLRGSIGTLRNAIKYTIDDSVDFESIKKMMKSFYPVIDSTYDLLENLLTWAQYNKGQLKPNFELIDMKSLCEISMSHISHIAKNKGITIINNSEPIEIEADKFMLLTVFRNVASNAIKFSHANSTVLIECDKTSTSINIQISDEGIGIPPNVLDKIFVSSHTIFHTKGTFGERGSGLGLSICKDFIELHHGKIWVKSVEGKGSTFNIHLPLRQSNK